MGLCYSCAVVCLPCVGVCDEITFVKITSADVHELSSDVFFTHTVVSPTPVSHKHPHEVPPL